MAEGQEERDTEDLSDEASPYRAEEFRRKGQVAQSREVSGLVALLAAGGALWVLSPSMGAQLAEFMREMFGAIAAKPDLTTAEAIRNVFWKCLKVGALLTLPIAGFGFALGALGSFAQIGSVFSTEPLTPDLNKIDPVQGAKRLFSMRTLIEGLRLVAKMAIILSVAWAALKSDVLRAPAVLDGEAATILVFFSGSAKTTFLSLCGVLLVFAILDFTLQKHEFNKKLRLTKQEMKQEFKEREGDPQIKARIRAVQREVARKRMMQAVKTADAIVTNPTHIAVAIKYDREKMDAPKVVAKGADLLAQRIREIAKEAGVPLVENVPLARTLYKTVKVGQAVPRALYQAVAEVLAYVYRLRGRGL
jgi:flagellar biosynthetic protein FlhB